MLVRFSTLLPCSVADAAGQVAKPQLLEHVASPLVHFRPIDPPAFPETWSEATYWVGLRIMGLVPFGRQAIRISFPATREGFAVRDNGYSTLITRWDHLVTITPSTKGCRYEDRVSISAGVLTPLVWLFAAVFYLHRQRRWRTLARSGFSYGDA